MKRILTILCCILTASVMAIDVPRLQIGATSWFTTLPVTASIPTVKFGMSELIGTPGTGAVYTVLWGRYGSDEGRDLKAIDLEAVYFPSKPLLTDKGLQKVKMFVLLGGDLTNIALPTNDPITYLQAATGGGLYWDFSARYALWTAIKLEISDKTATGQVGLGLSIKI